MNLKNEEIENAPELCWPQDFSAVVSPQTSFRYDGERLKTKLSIFFG
jgi:hypothetical protein